MLEISHSNARVLLHRARQDVGQAIAALYRGSSHVSDPEEEQVFEVVDRLVKAHLDSEIARTDASDLHARIRESLVIPARPERAFLKFCWPARIAFGRASRGIQLVDGSRPDRDRRRSLPRRPIPQPNRGQCGDPLADRTGDPRPRGSTGAIGSTLRLIPATGTESRCSKALRKVCFGPAVTGSGPTARSGPSVSRSVAKPIANSGWSPSRKHGIRFDDHDSQLPRDVAVLCDINSMTVPALMDDVLADFQLRAETPSGAERDDFRNLVWARLKPGRSHSLISAARSEIDAKERRPPSLDPLDRPGRTTEWHGDLLPCSKASNRGDEQYQLVTHIDPDAKLEVHSPGSPPKADSLKSGR